MKYVIWTLVGDLKYFIQLYKGEYFLNGLINNALTFENLDEAKEESESIAKQSARGFMVNEYKEIPKFEYKNSEPTQIDMSQPIARKKKRATYKGESF